MAVFLCATILFSIFLLFALFQDDLLPKAPQLPQSSKPGQITLTSDGCCLTIKEIRVLLQSSDGNQVEVSNVATIYEQDIIENELPNFAVGPVELLVEFQVYYGDWQDFSAAVMDFPNIGDLEADGVLLAFHEWDGMSFCVSSGSNEITYKLDISNNQWLMV